MNGLSLGPPGGVEGKFTGWRSRRAGSRTLRGDSSATFSCASMVAAPRDGVHPVGRPNSGLLGRLRGEDSNAAPATWQLSSAARAQDSRPSAARAIDDANAMLIAATGARRDVASLLGKRRGHERIGAARRDLQLPFVTPRSAAVRARGTDRRRSPHEPSARSTTIGDVAAADTPSVLPVISHALKRFFSH